MGEDKKQLNLPQREEDILAFWEREKIFEKSLARTKKGKPFVFYEGPPTANGNPGIHHFEARAFKDVIPRYKTMCGFFVGRKAGWDTHGLPVEIQVEKELGLKTKRDIERYGVAAFNQKCRESVWKYKEEWDRFTKRIGFWLDLEHPYITYETSYMETLWWVMKEVWKKGMLYRDFKIIPWCPRCQTGLSSHELGQPGAYKKVTDRSVFVRFHIKDRKNESLLVWTTTPWTIPANVAVAVNPAVEYTKWKVGGEFVWSATTPPYDPKKGEKPEFIERVSGKTLVGLKYEPPYHPKLEVRNWKLEIPYQVVGADFVETAEGSGMVHLAPAFGEEDMIAVKAQFSISNSQNEGTYPILETVNPDGTMKPGVIGEGLFVKEADPVIIEDLKERKLLFAVLSYEHEYPHCWRCDTPLLYFAKNSWWIRMTALKEKLIRDNKTVDWIPAHLRDGRFGEFLGELRDWAFSRERYWGTPLPIWQCHACGYEEAVGSLAELSSHSPQSGNTYIVMRHGESEIQLLGIAANSNSKYHLTEKGKKQTERAAQKLKKENIDIILYSPVMRTKETADIVAKELGVRTVLAEKRLHEIDTGVFDGRPIKEYHGYYGSLEEKFVKRPPKGESLGDLKKRLMECMADLEEKYENKKILLISHEYPIWILDGASRGLDNAGIAVLHRKNRDYIGLAEARRLAYFVLPRDTEGSVNLHRPFVDTFVLVCVQCGKDMRRVPDVVDVWFDSGAMPFAQAHYPFALPQSKKQKDSLAFPADYIAEAVDQTRGWFYTLFAVAALLGKGAPYKHVISLGHVLDKNGQKMSKSKGNVVNPWDMISKYGADTIRWYFYTVNAPGDPKRFDEKDLAQKLRGPLATLWNSFVLFDTYAGKIQNSKFSAGGGSALGGKIQNLHHVLDRWILTRVEEVTAGVTMSLERYDIVTAARALESFVVEDFSNWYLRRSRRRFQKPERPQDKKEAEATTAYVLVRLAELFAPFTPFLADGIYRELKRHMSLKEASVHLRPWPEAGKKRADSEKIMNGMRAVRELIASLLALRAEAGIKVRQPLSQLEIPNSKFQIPEELFGLVQDEVNVKNVVSGKELKLDITITPELREEGRVREIIRNVQEMRKDAGLQPRHQIRLQFAVDGPLGNVLSAWKTVIQKETGAKQFILGGKKVFALEREVMFENDMLWIGIDKVGK